MNHIKSSDPGPVIFKKIKEKFSVTTLWQYQDFETQLTILCSELPIPDGLTEKKLLITKLKEIKKYIVSKEINPTELKFLDEEIERYEKTVDISLYYEKEDMVTDEEIENFMRLSGVNEGVMGIHPAYNYEQLKKLTQGIYKRTNLVKFFISQEKTINGKIVAEIYEYPQDVPVAVVCEQLKIDKNTGVFPKKVFLFGESPSKKEWKVLREISLPFRFYRFVSEHQQEFIMLTRDSHEMGDYVVTGVTTSVSDYKFLTESKRVLTKLPMIFAQKVQNRIVKFDNHAQFKKRLHELSISKGTIFNYPFTFRDEHEYKYGIYSDWFKWFIWGWLTHSNKGVTNKYPMHVMVLGSQGSGKSHLSNVLSQKSREVTEPFSGESGTLKKLIPSFRNTPKPGYLAESNRFCFLDEFLRMTVAKSGMDTGMIDESLASMNSLLEHQKREVGSGVGSIRVNMTSRVFATTNPVRGIKSIADMPNKYDHSWLSRFVILWQTKEDIEAVRDAEDEDFVTTRFWLDSDDWVSILDYLQSFHATYDKNRIIKIFKEPIPLLTQDLQGVYKARYKHHINCLMDGIVKARCLFDHDMAFSATQKDYNMLRIVWHNLLKGWVSNVKDLSKLPVDKRKYYLPESALFLFNKICDFKKPLSGLEVKHIDGLDTYEISAAYQVLLSNGLVSEDNRGLVRPYYMDKDFVDDNNE